MYSFFQSGLSAAWIWLKICKKHHVHTNLNNITHKNSDKYNYSHVWNIFLNNNLIQAVSDKVPEMKHTARITSLVMQDFDKGLNNVSS